MRQSKFSDWFCGGIQVWLDVLYSDSEFFCNLERAILLNNVSLPLTVGGGAMKGKKAVIVTELVDESVATSNSAIVEEMLEWFKDKVVLAPWVKEIKKILIQEF